VDRSRDVQGRCGPRRDRRSGVDGCWLGTLRLDPNSRNFTIWQRQLLVVNIQLLEQCRYVQLATLPTNARMLHGTKHIGVRSVCQPWSGQAVELKLSTKAAVLVVMANRSVSNCFNQSTAIATIHNCTVLALGALAHMVPP